MQRSGSSIFLAACGVFSCGMQTLSCGIWNLVPLPKIKPRSPALGVWHLSHWTTREVPATLYLGFASRPQAPSRVRVPFMSSGFPLSPPPLALKDTADVQSQHLPSGPRLRPNFCFQEAAVWVISSSCFNQSEQIQTEQTWLPKQSSVARGSSQRQRCNVDNHLMSKHSSFV